MGKFHKIICVLGMVGSGTSLMCMILDRLRVYFGPEENLTEPYDSTLNFWEHRGVDRSPDDTAAIREFERLRGFGPSFMVFAWPAFWWLDYYSELNRYLRSKFHCIFQNERLIVFDLRS